MGLIPASAGSITVVAPTIENSRAHPRERGEHSTLQNLDYGDQGLIPASAGSISKTLSAWAGPRAHPRERGEHITHEHHPNHRRGSSPRARGALAERDRPDYPPGLIPASAGSIPLH